MVTSNNKKVADNNCMFSVLKLKNVGKNTTVGHSKNYQLTAISLGQFQTGKDKFSYWVHH